jgi:phosphopantetheine adenylyltransferase
VKEIARLGGDISRFVSPAVCTELVERINGRVDITS